MVDITPPVARIVLSNPPLNVIDIPMMEELAQALAEIEARSDVSDHRAERRGQGIFSWRRCCSAHSRQSRGDAAQVSRGDSGPVASKKVTIAAVHGHCLGGGAELAMVCDMVYTAASAQWGFPEIKLGCYPPVACTALAALVGQKRACGIDSDWTDDQRHARRRRLVWRIALFLMRSCIPQSIETVQELLRAESCRIGCHQESHLRVGCDAFRQRPGAG